MSSAAPAPASGELFCPGCGYDLRAIEGSERCPECGLAIDREQLAVSRIPWSHRRRIGRVRAYWRTVWLATFQTRRLGDEVARPVDFGDAQRFRLVTVAIATLSAVGVLFTGVTAAGGLDTMDPRFIPWLNPYGSVSSGGSGPPPGAYDIAYTWVVGALLAPVMPLGVLGFALLLTGVASYWFHPASLPVRRQNRAVALSYYACAPLAFLPLPAAGWVVMLLVIAADDAYTGMTRSRLFLVLVLAIHSGVLVIGLALYVATLRLLRRTTAAAAGRTAVAAVVVPITWLLSGVVALFALPWVAGFVRLVVDSLR